MKDDRVYIVAYDISDSKRWRRVYRTMQGYGEWIQLSIFQCRMSKLKKKELEIDLGHIVKKGEDHVLIIDVGEAGKVSLSIDSIGKGFKFIEKKAIII